MPQVEAEQASLARGATVDDDRLVGGEPGRFEILLHLGERSELVGVVRAHQTSPVETGGAGDVAFPQPDVVIAEVFVARPGVDEHGAGAILGREQFAHRDPDPERALLRERALGIAEVLLGHLKASRLPVGKPAIDDADVLDPELFEDVGHHAGAQDLVVRQPLAGRVDEVRSIAVDTGPHEQGPRQVVREVLDRDALVGAPEGVEIDVVGGGDVPAEVVLVATAGVEHDRPRRRVGRGDELVRFGG